MSVLATTTGLIISMIFIIILICVLFGVFIDAPISCKIPAIVITSLIPLYIICIVLMR
jgi:hypothetical protein